MLKFDLKQTTSDNGAYGLVCFSPDGKATKIFYKRTEACEQHVKDVFKSEVCAYTKISKIEDLKNLVPYFYGPVIVDEIVDTLGVDISHQFHLDYAYQMNQIPGQFVKIGTLTDSTIRQNIIDRFKSFGINHVCDASVIVTNGMVTCVIDFALKEFVLEHPSAST
jgi:hypothetical protein